MTKRSAHRPSKYDPKYCEDMLEWFQCGDWSACPTFEEYATKIGVASCTLRKWRDEQEEFSSTYAMCKDIQFKNLFSGGLIGEFKGSFICLAMKNMQGWKEKQEQEMTGSMAVETLESYLRRKKQEGEDA